MPSRAPNRNAVCLAVLLLAVAADQITKWWARSALADGRSIACAIVVAIMRWSSELARSIMAMGVYGG